ncbi:MAG TPA: rod shape-determining protein MreD [Candidatus Omnitrophota bacterium]|nr:rod shape-determining protein MreD [Candidatus Omnitrophota bacterium]
MKRLIVITLLVFVFFLLEFFIFNLIGGWLTPSLLILLIIFFNLYLGIRYGLYTAILAGVLKDSFSSTFFGLNIVTFIVCAYLTTVLRKYIYYRGSRLSRLLLVFLICLVDFICRLVLHAILGSLDAAGAFKFVLFSGVVTTLLATTYTFQQLKRCVSKLFV